MKDIKFYKTADGKILLEVVPNKDSEGLKELIPGEVDAAKEKHVPEISFKDNKLIVDVGSIEHPMMDAHYIQFIALITDRGVEVINLKPGEKPHAEFEKAKHGIVYEYCNLHGLWKKEF